MLVLDHKGYSVISTKHPLSFKKLIEYGVNGVELDVVN